MSVQPTLNGRIEEQFSLPLFLFTITVSLAALAVLLKLVAPDAVWAVQTSAGVGHLAVAFLTCHLLTCFIEYGFHRYVLHKPVVPFLSQLYRQHTLHHSLTRIGKRYTSAGREVPFVENIYPVTTPEQGEASFFPWFSLLVFAGVVTPVAAVLQWLAPSFPWFFGAYGAVAFALALYEIFHAIEHWSFERWAPLIEHRQFGWFWRKVYSFHLRHHAVIDCNEAISGFFTLPVFDWVFGTFVLPKTLYTDGSEWMATEFTSPRPVAVIRWCDAQTDELVKRRRAEAQVATAAPATYTRGELIAHYFTHSTGLVASVAALVVLIVFAALRGNGWHMASAIVFGAALVGLYAAFMNFRQARPSNWRELIPRYNHAAAFLLIAGTATPFLLVNLRGPWGWSLLGVVWALCLAGGLSRVFFKDRMENVATFAYLLLGVTALIALKPFIAALPLGALWLLLGGIACYSLGSLFHVSPRVRYHQVVRQVFVLGGSVCHLLAVVLFVLPRGA